MPWLTFNKPGFLQNQELSTLNLDLEFAKYYRDMLGLHYCKIQNALKSKLEVDNPIVVSLSLDAWSAHYHGYLWFLIHFISDWHLRGFHFVCIPFYGATLRKTYMYKKIENASLDGDIINKVQLCLRDSARNITAAFNEPNCLIKSSPCLNQWLHLVIKCKPSSMTSVESLIKK